MWKFFCCRLLPLVLLFLFLVGHATSGIAYLIEDAADPSLQGGTVIDFSEVPLGTYHSGLTIGEATFVPVSSYLEISTMYSGFYNTTGPYLQNQDGFNTLRVDFANPASAIGFNWGASDYIWLLNAYRADGALLDSVEIPIVSGSNAGEFYGIAVNGIDYIILQNMSSYDWILIDNFTFVLGMFDPFAGLSGRPSLFSPNQEAVLAVLVAAAPGATGQFSDDLQSLAALDDGPFAEALDQLSPEVYAGLRDAGQYLARIHASTIQQRLGTLQNNRTAGLQGKLMYASTAEVMTDVGPMTLVASQEQGRSGIWVRPYYMGAEQNRSHRHFGFDYDAWGVSIGADYQVADNAYIGLMLGLADGRLKYSRVGAKTEIDSYYGGLYGSLQRGHLFWHGQFSWMRHDYETSRSLDFIDPARAAKSEHSADQFNLAIGVDYLGMQVGGWNLIPVAAVQAAYYDEDGFTERGADDFNLVAKGVDEFFIATRLGARVNRAIETATLTLIPELSLQWGHEFGDRDRQVKARFAGAEENTFVVKGVEPKRDSLLLGAGVAAMLGERTAVFAKYNGEFRGNLMVWDASLGVRTRF